MRTALSSRLLLLTIATISTSVGAIKRFADQEGWRHYCCEQFKSNRLRHSQQDSHEV
jgi:hypothetical protein